MNGLRHKRLVKDSRHSPRDGSSQRSSAGCVKTQRSNAQRVECQRGGAGGVNSPRDSAGHVSSPIDSAGHVNSPRDSAGHVNSQRNSSDSSNSHNNSANNVNPIVGAVLGINAEMSAAEDELNEEANATPVVSVDPPKRGRKKRARTELRLPPSTGKVQLEPKGSMQFTYVNYNPKDYKYGSQVGTILKRCYPGIVKICDENGTVVAKRAALSWNDYTWKRHEIGLSHARAVKREFWNVFTVSRQHKRQADCNLEAYLAKRVSDIIHQARLDAVKMHFDRKGEHCDDTRARTILLTEKEYLACRLWWTNKATWRYLSHYWTTDEYLEKRRRAQESRLKQEEDSAQNRGGSRPWSETQQFLEHKYGAEKAGTLNTYAVMKSGIKKVDKSGKSGPIPSQKAKKILDDYKVAVGPADNSKELDGKVLYRLGGGLRHGRVPMGNGAIDKKAVLVAAKSKRAEPSVSTATYQAMVEENQHLRQANEILIEENGVNRDFMLRVYSDLGKPVPADLLDRLASIDARRQETFQGSTSHQGSHPHDMLNTIGHGSDNEDHSNDDDRGNMDTDDDDHSNEGGHQDME